MSARDSRKEAASVARGLRRYLEREDAAGRGDLLYQSARAKGVAAPGMMASGPEASRQPATERAATPSAGPAPGPIEASRPPEAAPSPAPGLTGPKPRSGPSRPPAPQAAGPAVNLFGEPDPPPRTPSIAVEEFDDEPPVLHASNPAGVADRAALYRHSIPVLDQVAAEARACTRCGLCQTRTQAVPGVGSAQSGIVFVGEAPGADEDRRGEPFVGRAGELLTRVIKAMDDAQLIPGVPLSRETVYICNVLKCRPPENRNPLPPEIEACSPYLRRQLEALKPRVICCLGKFAAELLVGVKGTIGGLRGKIYRYQGAKLIVTYHPAACLRNPAYKRPVWEDMQLLAREYQTD